MLSPGAVLHVVQPAPTLASLVLKALNFTSVSLSHKLKPQWKILVPAQTYGKVTEHCHLPSHPGPKACSSHTARLWSADVWVDASCQSHISHEWRVPQLPGEQCIWSRWLSLLYPPVNCPECYLATSERHLNGGHVTHYFVAFKDQPLWVFCSCSSFLP